MQHETGGILRLTARYNSLIKLLILPFLQTRRLLGREITTHGERGIRQEDGVFVAFGVCGHTRAILRPFAVKVNTVKLPSRPAAPFAEIMTVFAPASSA